MDFSGLIDVMKQRMSIRKFQEKEVTDDQVSQIIEAANSAPSSMNTQPWRFVVLKDKEKRKELAQAYKEVRERNGLYEQDTDFLKHATPILVLCEDEKYGKVLSCGMAIQNMLLAATALGLGSLSMGAPLMDAKSLADLRRIFEVDESKKIVLLTAFGYSAEKPAPKEKKSAKELVNYV